MVFLLPTMFVERHCGHLEILTSARTSALEISATMGKMDMQLSVF